MASPAKTREQIREDYSQYPDHVLEHVVRLGKLAEQQPGVVPGRIERRIRADVAREILREREVA